MLEKNEIETIQALLERAHAPQVAGLNSQPFLVLEQGQHIQSLEELESIPSRKKGGPSFRRADSFCAYVNQQKTPDSRLYVSGQIQLVAVLNHHGEEPGWQDHLATFFLTETEEWKTWSKNNLQAKTQRDFALFIEDNADDIVEPSGADLLDLIRTIRLSQHVECTGEIDERGDTHVSGFTIATKTKSGARQDLELPAEFTVALAPYEGGEKLMMKARLRIQAVPPKLMLHYELVRIEQSLKAALEKIVAVIAKETEMEPWYGIP